MNWIIFKKVFSSTWVAIFLAGAIGVIAWGYGLMALALAPLLVPLWASRKSRITAWLTVLTYYLAAARGLPYGAAQFFDHDQPVIFSLVLWGGASLVLSIPWGILWARTGYVWRVPIVLILSTVPPIGIVGWANPLVATGVFFPAWSWFGLAAMLVALITLCYWPLRTGGILIVSALAGLAVSTPDVPTWVQSYQTRYGGAGEAGRDFLRDYAANQNMIKLAFHSNYPVVLFPETVAGLWNEATIALWEKTATQLRAANRTLLVGAEVAIEGTYKTRNSLVFIGRYSGALVQRIPVPISMWKPWSNQGTEANIFSDGIGIVNGQRVATFICYEQLLVWPMLLSQAASPKLMIGAANDYWAATTSIPLIQTVTLRAWSRLYHVPLILAINL